MSTKQTQAQRKIAEAKITAKIRACVSVLRMAILETESLKAAINRFPLPVRPAIWVSTSTYDESIGLGLSMHSNSHLGISLMAMTHLAASVPQLSYACDTHYPWQDDEVVQGGRMRFEDGSLRVTRTPGLGVTLDSDALARLHDNYLNTSIRYRDDLAQMRKYAPAFTGEQPRF